MNVSADARAAHVTVYFENTGQEFLSWEDGKLKDIDGSLSKGAGVQVNIGEMSGYCSTTRVNVNNLKECARIAATGALHSGPVPAQQIIGAPAEHDNLYAVRVSPLDVELSPRISLLQTMEHEARLRSDKIVQVMASFATVQSTVIIATSLGQAFHDVRPLVRLNCQCVAKDGDRSEVGYSGGGGRFEFDFVNADVRNTDTPFWMKHVRDAATEAVENLTAAPAPAGEMTVVLASGWTGILLHEAIGHGLEGDFNQKKTSVFSDLLGKRVAQKGVNVVDNGTLRNRRGSLTVDDEGTPTGCALLIEDGILNGYMHSRQSAHLMGLNATGNGRRQSFAHISIPRMTNTYMLAGETNPYDIIADVQDGLYVVNMGGGSVNITSGDFNFAANSARMIKNGRLGDRVRGAILIGKGSEALKKIFAVGNDLQLDDGVGTCGKDGQSVPVGVGLPTTGIHDLTVGGTGG
jgi:TldD protein